MLNPHSFLTENSLYLHGHRRAVVKISEISFKMTYVVKCMCDNSKFKNQVILISMCLVLVPTGWVKPSQRSAAEVFGGVGVAMEEKRVEACKK